MMAVYKPYRLIVYLLSMDEKGMPGKWKGDCFRWASFSDDKEAGITCERHFDHSATLRQRCHYNAY